MCNRTKFDTCWATVILTALLFATPAAADPPDILRNFRLIPRHSTLNITGGFAGVDETLHPVGKFGLTTGYADGFSCMAIGCPPPPTNVPFAKFIDVQARLVPKSPFFGGQSLDDLLNLSGLYGTFTTPDRLQFHGVDGQGAPFQLKATIAGRLIHLVGRNDAPCCDFFNYRFDAYAHLAPFADFNFDGAVDSADYTMWRNHVGMTSGATLEHGDADGDGDVDAADYAIWRQDAGTVIDMSALAVMDEASGTVLTIVPEPSTLSLLVCGVLFFVGLSQWLTRRDN